MVWGRATAPVAPFFLCQNMLLLAIKLEVCPGQALYPKGMGFLFGLSSVDVY